MGNKSWGKFRKFGQQQKLLGSSVDKIEASISRHSWPQAFVLEQDRGFDTLRITIHVLGLNCSLRNGFYEKN